MVQLLSVMSDYMSKSLKKFRKHNKDMEKSKKIKLVNNALLNPN
jgi:hypothetical protein